MVKIDERFNIEKSVVDCQMMRLELFNVDVNSIESGIIIIYDREQQYIINHNKFYEDNGCVKMFFLLNNIVKKGEYKYRIELTLKESCKINVLSERSFIVHD